MSAFQDLTGKVYGRLTVLSKDHSEPLRGWFWLCRCECGREVVKCAQLFKKGDTKSCGVCLYNETRLTCNRKHGMCYTKEYTIYHDMKDRCYNENYKQFSDYGGRGITVCPEWLGENGFVKFIEDMGPREKGLTLERIDCNGNYCKDNCKWDTRKNQNRNRRNTHRYEYKGEKLTAGQISEKTGVPEKTFIARVSRLGWTVEEAADTPVAPKK